MSCPSSHFDSPVRQIVLSHRLWCPDCVSESAKENFEKFSTRTDKVTISRDARFLELDDGSSQDSLQKDPSQEPEDAELVWPLRDNVEQQAEEEDIPSEQGEDPDEESVNEDFFDVEDQDPEEDPLAVKQEEEEPDEEGYEEEARSDQAEGVRQSGRRTRGVLPTRLSDFVGTRPNLRKSRIRVVVKHLS
nr:major centromere autoantigen B-like [Aedes albopictus]